MTALNGQSPVPTDKINKNYFMIQNLRYENLKEFEGLKKGFKLYKRK